MKKKRVYILAPNDRFNYGDLLFPYILEKYIREVADRIFYVSTSASDLSKLGGIKTVDYHILYNLPNDTTNILIIAGGECLFAKWSLLRFVYSKYNQQYLLLNKISPKRWVNILIEKIIILQEKVRTKYPFTIGVSELPNLHKVIYNSVGCTNLDKKKYILRSSFDNDIIKSATYVSVRDKSTSRGLKKMNTNHEMLPDCAIQMSRLFSSDFIESNCRPFIRQLIKTNYIYFQIGKEKLKGHETQIVSTLQNIQKKTKCKFVFCPIGTAYGHEDNWALDKIASNLDKDFGFNIKEPNIWEIMALIKYAKLYMGSSLHGTISAMSFGVPFITYSAQKIKNYIETWYDKDSSRYFSSYEDLYDKVLDQYENPIVHDQAKQIELSINSLRKIASIIN